jgi:hypothetical protein
MLSHPQSLACPHCQHGNRVEQVSALVARSTTTGMSYGWTVGHAGRQRFHGNTVAWSRHQTMLAAMLAPPRRPLPLVGCGAGIAVPLLVLTLLCSLSEAATMLAQANVEVFLLCAVFALLPVVIFVVLIRGVRANATFSQRALLEWQRQMQKWQALYYCHRCGGVFMPGSGIFVLASATHAFLAQP